MNVQTLKQIQQLLLTIPTLSTLEQRAANFIAQQEQTFKQDVLANDKIADADDYDQSFLHDVCAAMKQLLESKAYEQDVRLIEQMHAELRQQNVQLDHVRQAAEQTSITAAPQASVIVLEQWLAQDGQRFQYELPIHEWQRSIDKHRTLLANIYQFNQEAQAYMSTRQQQTKNVAKRLMLKKKKLRYLNEEGQRLAIEQSQLMKDIALFEEEMHNIRLAWQLHQPVLRAFYEQTPTTYAAQSTAQIKRNKDSLHELSHIMRKWRALVELDVLIHSLPQHATLPHIDKLSFPHAYTYSELEQMLLHYNNLFSIPLSTAAHSTWQEQALILPEIQVGPIAVQTKKLHAYTGLIVVPAAVAIFFTAYTIASTTLSEKIETVTSSFSESKETETTEVENTATADAPEQREVIATSANIQHDDVRQKVGYVVPAHNNVPIYSHPDADEAPIGYLTAGQSYDILAVSERLRMKLSDDEWLVYDANDLQFEQQELAARLQPIYAPLHEATVKSSTMPVFSEPSRDSDIIGYVENASTVTIYNTAYGNWIDIGNEAWVEETKHLSISWPYTEANTLPNPIGQATVTTSDFLNVRSQPGLGGQIVGRLDEHDNVYVYAVDASTGWLKVGPDGWISGDVEYVNYMVY